MINIALIDDHILLRSGLAGIVNTFENYKVVIEADNGNHFIQSIKKNIIPDIVLLDINMPEMDGFETAKWIKENHPSIKILIITMIQNDTAVIRLLKLGINGYILKDSPPSLLKNALDIIAEKGFFTNEFISAKMLQLIARNDKSTKHLFTELSEKQIDFLKLCCTEKSYKEIAVEMKIPPRSVEQLRSDMFEKIETTSRVGLALFAIRSGLFII